MADRIAVMRRGEIVEAGPAATLLQQHAASLLEGAAARRRRTSPPGRRACRATGQPLLGRRRRCATTRCRAPDLFAPAPRLRAVDGVSFTVRRGESVGLVGESGCGKSTLARAILALEPVQGGAIRLGGEDVAGTRRAPVCGAFRRRVQMVFQDPYGSFDPRHRAGRIVAEPLHLLRGRTRRRASASAWSRTRWSRSACRLTTRANIPHEFSGGQRQRLAIARALITRPELIVLDEPVSALDVSIRAQVLDLLADLQARLGLTYLFISHDLAVVRAITDRVLVMQKGRIVEEGATSQVLDAPQHAYARALVESALHLDRVLAERKAGQLAQTGAN